jgi:hypothetical protein
MDRAEMLGPDQIKLFWSSPWRPKDRIQIRGGLPKWHDDFTNETDFALDTASCFLPRAP